MSGETALAAATLDGKAHQPAIYFDGVTNRRRVVELRLGAKLDLAEDDTQLRPGLMTTCARPTAAIARCA